MLEPAAPKMKPSEALENKYDVFSARYANLYTVRQLRQLFERAFGRFIPQDDIWAHKDGGFVDVFRPEINLQRYQAVQAVLGDRAIHLADVRKMLEEMDVFMFTFGLTEGWVSLIDGAIYPFAPPVSGGKMDAERYGFTNLSVAEVEEDTRSFVQQLRLNNPTVKIVLTVSPVPLVATYEDRSVICASSLSKSVLRVAAENLYRSDPKVAYYPSFEIITGSFAQGRHF